MSIPTQNFIGPVAPPATRMEDVEFSAETAPNVSSTLVASPKAPVCLPRGAGSDPAAGLQVSISLLHEEIVSLYALIASSNGTTDELRSYREKVSKKMGDLDQLGRAQKLIQATAGSTLAGAKLSNVVPRNLPLFQWENQVSVPGAPVFVDVNTCIMNFTDVMISHNLDLDANYLRVLPPLLAGTIRLWFEDFVTQFRKLYQQDPSWIQFSTAMQDRYGLNVQEERNNCARELNSIMMYEGENLESFIDRFNSLRRRAVDQVLPNSLLIERFLLALPRKVAEYINVAIVNLPEYKRQDIEVLSDLARRLQNSTLFTMRANTMVAPLMPPRAPKRAAMHIDQNDAVHRSSNRSRHAVNLARAAAPTGTTTGESSSSAAVSVVPQPTDKYCTFHKAKSHNTSECRAAAAAGTNVKPRVKYCHGCGVAGWNPRHECATAKRTSPPNTNQEYNFGAMTLQQGSNVVGPANASSAVPSVPSVPFVPSAVSSVSVTTSRAELQAAYNAGVADATADIQELSIADDEDVIMDIQAQNCKYHNVFSSLPENKSNMIIIPIIIQNIKTYAIVDTGATFAAPGDYCFFILTSIDLLRVNL
ncbi:hypothetical protein HPULCUR_007668 [Helicostylum pulchrum]|uniref:Retrotransposon gag domain-containing protein n=1 Tax=Helicostylum pulchrum TaxID=562976 RepID=A0ABP9Y5E3_9FUNG